MDKLLELLNENAKFTTSELAVILNEDEDEIKNRIKNYENNDVIKGYKAIINWNKTDVLKVYALIDLKVIPKKDTGFDGIAKKIMQFDEVINLYLMSGSYDLSVMVKGKTMRDVAEFVAKRLSTLESVTATATHFLLSKYKEDGVILFDNEEQEQRSMLL